MLLAAALDRIAELPHAVPRSRLHALLRRLGSGCDLGTALALEPLGYSDAAKLDAIADQEELVRNPILFAELIEQAYRRAELAAVEPEVVWTGPRTDPAIPYVTTFTAARRIVDDAKREIYIAGYHVTIEALERINLWQAIERGVLISVLVDGYSLTPEDKNILLARGVTLRTVSTSGRDFAKFHVKAIIADDSRALVGSANFTTLGHSANIELGLAVEGTAAATIAAMLRSYVVFAENAGWVISK